MTPNTQPPNSQEKNFLASLFDFGFTSFVTLRFLKVIYAIVVVVILIIAVFTLIASFQTGQSLIIVTALFLVPIGTLIYLIFARITFEIIAMFFRIGDNTFLTVQLLGGRPSQWSVPGAPAGYGPPPDPVQQAAPNAPWGYGTGAPDPSTSATTVTQYGATPAPYGQPSQGQYGQPPQSPQGPYGQPSEASQGSQGQYGPPPKSPQGPYGPPSEGSSGPYGQPSEGSQGQYGQPSEGSQGQYGKPPEPPSQPGQERWGQSPNQP